MIRMMDPNPAKRYNSKDIQDSNWIESTIAEFNLANSVDSSTLAKTLELWISMGSMNDIEKCIQRAISKSIEVINVNFIHKLFFSFDKNNHGRFDKSQFVNTLNS